MLTTSSGMARRVAARAAIACLAFTALAIAQPTARPNGHNGKLSPPANGPRKADPTWHAIRNATLHARPGLTVDHATIVFRDGVITAVLEGQAGPDGQRGTDDDVPAPLPMGPRVWDATGLHVYPGFIDPYVEVDAPAPDPTSPGLHWNTRVTPQRRATDGKGIEESRAESLRKQGFTAAAVAPRGGIFRGQSAVVSLATPDADPSIPRPPVYRDGVYHSVAFETGGFGFGGEAPGTPGERPSEPNTALWSSYPGSQMGAIALIRQTFIDTDWQSAGRVAGSFVETNAVDSLNLARGAAPVPILFNADDELEALRALKIAAEFKRPAMLLGSGLEFRRLPAIVEACSGAQSDADVKPPMRRSDHATPIILPLNFARTPEVNSLGAAENVELRELMTWEQSPTNPRRLYAAGLTIALTTAKLRDTADFRKNLARAMRHGLPEDAAFAMVTTVPAEILGVADRMGTVEVGKAANLIVADGPLFVPEKPRHKKIPGQDDKKADAEKKAEAAKDAEAREGAEKDAPAPDKVAQQEDPKPEVKPDAEQAERPRARARRGRPGREADQPESPEGEADKDKDTAKESTKEATKESKIRDVWIDGLRHEITPPPAPDLSGSWAVTIEPARFENLRFEIASENAITLKAGDQTVKAQGVTIADRRISLVFDGGALGGKGFETLAGVIQPKALFGTGLAADGSRYTWRAEPAKPPPAAGRWRAVEADGQIKNPDARDGLTIDLAEGKLKLTFVRKSGEEIVIESDDAKLTETGATFSHPLEKIGGEGVSKDTVTVEGDTLIGESTLPDGSTHAYKAVRLPEESKAKAQAARAQPRTLPGTYLITTVDDRARPLGKQELLFVVVRPDNTLTLSGSAGEASATEVKADGDRITYTVDSAPAGGDGIVRASARRFGDLLIGSFQHEGDQPHAWKAVRVGPHDQKIELKDIDQNAIDLGTIAEQLGTPFGPYALAALPRQEYTLFTGATLWTNTDKGIITDGVVLISEGKIGFVGSRKDWDAFVKTARLKGGMREVDLKGKHLTPGLIDCHSHTGISRGVNEGGQAVTAEVRIEDVTNPDAISWYRQLAGGITAVNSLHGSANAIGGQNCVNKNRWGAPHPDDLHFEGATPGIKFALGENPKRSNSTGERSGDRYPQTRMGVEAIIRDRFTAAREYAAREQSGGLHLGDTVHVYSTPGDGTKYGGFQMNAPVTEITPDGVITIFLQDEFENTGKKVEVQAKFWVEDVKEGNRVHVLDLLEGHISQPGHTEILPRDAFDPPKDRPRQTRSRDVVATLGAPVHRDLELEALAEILEGKRLVHCHSYRQDEILMLARLSREFGFRLGTYQHNLEGYKVATEVNESAIGASLFSDWWGYKVEVQDAIPFAGAIMHEQGVVVSFNSDSDELARRMNTEAAKAVRYGGVKPEEALKFVTLNPARQLKIDDRVGSLAQGKDADIALWSADPLSVYARCEATYVDGRCYFSLEQDGAHRERIASERTRLIQKAMGESMESGGRSGGGDGPARGFGGRGRRARPTDEGNGAGLDAIARHYLDLYLRGMDPNAAYQGECGCGLDH